MQRIGVGDEVSPNAIGVNQFDYSRLFNTLLENLIALREERIAIDVPTKRHMRNAEVRKNVVVKVVFADNEFVHPRQKRSRFSALNDAVIVRAADRDCLADAEL